MVAWLIVLYLCIGGATLLLSAYIRRRQSQICGEQLVFCLLLWPLIYLAHAWDAAQTYYIKNPFFKRGGK